MTNHSSRITVNMKPFAKARPRVTVNGTFMPAEYTQAKEELGWLYKEQGGELDVTGMIRITITFVMVMPKSWSKKRKLAQSGQWCLKKPDLDNMVGAVFDALLAEDSYVADLTASKVWGHENQIVIGLDAEEPWQYIPF